MKIDLADCIIKTPEGEDFVQLCDMLGDVFQIENDLFGNVSRGDRKIYHWTPYSLFAGTEIIGNVSLVDMKIFWDGRPLKLYGLASVATPEKYRGLGIAKHLMAHCLGIIDRENAPSVLFTSLPRVYEKSGYVSVENWIAEFAVTQNPFSKGNMHSYVLSELSQESTLVMDRIYREVYPDYDGKHIREDGFWQSARYMFNITPYAYAVFAGEEIDAQGYARFDVEGDRILVTEIVAAADAAGVAESLLYRICDFAVERGISKISLSLPRKHFAHEVFAAKGLTLVPEDGAGREVFMVRGSGGKDRSLANLEWSMADKF